MGSKQIEEQLNILAAKPGVYLFKDEAGNVLYVGKAANLHHRVRSYFTSFNNLSPKLQRMIARVSDFDFFLTDSEQEALLLECSLIKKHRPRYNVRLKDDKSYPYLKVSLSEDWPGVYITRRLGEDGARYFGPFASAGSVRKTLSLLKKLFPFRSCRKAITGKERRPCLDYYIHRCLGPCVGAVTKEEYGQVINQIILFLEGKQELIVRELRRKMDEAVEKLNFEKAALLRDQIRAVERVMERQKIAAPEGEMDVIAFARARDQAYVEVFSIRHGKLVGRENFIVEGTRDEEPVQIMTSFVPQFYNHAPYIPSQILLQCPIEEMELVQKWLGGKKGAEVRLIVPRRGIKKDLVDMVEENARQGLEHLRVKLLTEPDIIAAALKEIQKELGLPLPPKRVECYDISDIRGTSAVGSMVVFEAGLPKKSHYRRFKIKAVAGADDYAMIREVLRRRFRRAEPKEGSWAVIPDLVLIDGGKGHLNAALEVMHEQGVDSISCASIAKEKEEIFVPQSSEPILLPSHSPALYLLQRIRDEAHRFALGYFQRVHKKESFTSALDSIPGIGPKRKKTLLRKFGSLERIKEASVEELAAVKGMTRSVAEKVKEYL